MSRCRALLNPNQDPLALPRRCSEFGPHLTHRSGAFAWDDAGRVWCKGEPWAPLKSPARVVLCADPFDPAEPAKPSAVPTLPLRATFRQVLLFLLASGEERSHGDLLGYFAPEDAEGAAAGLVRLAEEGEISRSRTPGGEWRYRKKH